MERFSGHDVDIMQSDLTQEMQGIIGEVEADESLNNPEIYKSLVRNNVLVGEYFAKEGYTIEKVEPVGMNPHATLRTVREKQSNENSTIRIGRQGSPAQGEEFYIPMPCDGKGKEYLQKENGYGVVNADAPPMHYYSGINPTYKVTMRSRAYINERGEELIDIVEVFVYHIGFFGPFTPSLKPTVLEQIQRLATVSYDHGGKKYIGEHNVTEHCYLNYLLYKKNNMIRMGENGGTGPSDTSTYKNLTYEFFRSNVYIRDELYTQSVKRLQDILQK